MPKITEAMVKRESHDDPDDPCGPVEILRFSDTGGLTQFGANVEILPPGSASSVKHWHAEEDEMVYILSGELLLHEDDETIPLRAGDAATFKAGDPKAHCLENKSTAPARYLVIGTRKTEERITYPDRDRILHRGERSRWTDLAGNAADDPFKT
ncbi:cupin domain-containing protein [Aestuariibius sp. 2305UL40-4]|uniref:cupin domain-containing protein n=1 Tax=Aestuariibius violaceus TaxID=3234132 RepID=UPI00345EA890